MSPRIRTIKPETWADERIGGVSRDARLLFVTLITLADDEGRLRDLPAQILGHGFPYDEDAPSLFVRWLEQLASCGLVRRYSVAGSWYIEIPGFCRHQVINRPRPSVLPGPPDNGPLPQPPDGTPHGTVTEASVNDHGSITSRKGREGKGRETPPDPPIAKTRDGGELGFLPSASPKINPRARGSNPRRLGAAAAAAELRQQSYEAAATLAVPDTVDRLHWQRLRTSLKAAVPDSTWSVWIGRLDLAGLKDNTLVLDAPDHAWYATARVTKLIATCADSVGVKARIATTAEHDGLVA